MFIHDFVQIDLPAAEVQRRLAAGGSAALGGHADAAIESGAATYFRIGPNGKRTRLTKRARVVLEHPYVRGDAMVFPIQWTATGVPWLFPQLDADIEVAPVGESVTQLSLFGRYEPPLSVVGRAADNLLLHRIAEGSVRAFLALLGEGLAAPVLPNGSVHAAHGARARRVATPRGPHVFRPEPHS